MWHIIEKVNLPEQEWRLNPFRFLRHVWPKWSGCHFWQSWRRHPYIAPLFSFILPSKTKYHSNGISFLSYPLFEKHILLNGRGNWKQLTQCIGMYAIPTRKESRSKIGFSIIFREDKLGQHFEAAIFVQGCRKSFYKLHYCSSKYGLY